MFGLEIFVRVQTFRRVPPVLPCSFCHPALVQLVSYPRSFEPVICDIIFAICHIARAPQMARCRVQASECLLRRPHCPQAPPAHSIVHQAIIGQFLHINAPLAKTFWDHRFHFLKGRSSGFLNPAMLRLRQC